MSTPITIFVLTDRMRGVRGEPCFAFTTKDLADEYFRPYGGVAGNGGRFSFAEVELDPAPPKTPVGSPFVVVFEVGRVIVQRYGAIAPIEEGRVSGTHPEENAWLVWTVDEVAAITRAKSLRDAELTETFAAIAAAP